MASSSEEILMYAISELRRNLPAILGGQAELLESRLVEILDEEHPQQLSQALPHAMRAINEFSLARRFVAGVQWEVSRGPDRGGDYQPLLGHPILSTPANIEMICPEAPPGHCIRRARFNGQTMRCWAHPGVKLIPR